MKYRQTGAHLEVKVEGNLTLLAVRQIEPLLQNAEAVTLDLERSRIVDSEGVIFLYRIIRSRKTLRLKNVPGVLPEIISALGLEEVISLKEVTV